MSNPQQEKEKELNPLTQDVAYTINHALACTAADIASPFIGNWTQNYLGKRIEVGCGHDHTHQPILPMLAPEPAPLAKPKGLFTGLTESENDEGGYKPLKPVIACDHPPAPPPPPTSNLKHWWIGEIAGDFGAVPVTVALQRYLPGFMNGIRKLVEPFLAPLFSHGAARSAAKWAKEKGIAPESPEADAQQALIYEREMRHIPQAVVWTVTSTAINLGAQRISGNKGKWSHLIAGKLAGSAISAGLVVGFRGVAPQQAYRWDRFTSEHIFEPATRAITGAAWQEKVKEKNANEPVVKT